MASANLIHRAGLNGRPQCGAPEGRISTSGLRSALTCLDCRDDTRPHTPAPWKFEPETRTIRSVPTNYWLASMDSWDGAVNHDANARLIAAAPRMLDTLRECVKAYEEHRDGQPTGHLWPDPNHIFHARAVIAEATGAQS